MATEKKERVYLNADGTPAGGAKKAAPKPAAQQVERKAAAEPAERKPAAKPAASRPAKISAEAKKRAVGLRWGAVILWLLGLAFEVLTILLINGTFYIPGNKMAYIIIGIVLDLACVIAGSQLWKKANRIDPASEKNKVKFFLWNNLGVIASLVDFVPLVVILLKDKDLDEKTKKIASVVAVVAALAAVGTSVDYNPVSAEDLAAAQADTAAYTYDGTVYWTQFGKCYHFDDNCQSLRNSATLYQGTIEEAFEAKRSKACSFCADPDVIEAYDEVASASEFLDEITADDEELADEATKEIGDDLLAPAA